METEDLSSYVDSNSLMEAVRNLTGRRDVELEDGVEVKRATKAVQGLMSQMFRVHVAYRLGDGSTHAAVLILKCIPREGVQREVVSFTGAFTREGIFFEKLFPLFQRASGGKVTLPMPTCYHATYGGDNDALYLEDLCTKGFRTPGLCYLKSGLDLDHCRLSMEAYGRLHALTIVAETFLPKETSTWTEAFPVLAKEPQIYSTGPGKAPLPFKGMLDEAVETLLTIAKGLDGLPKEAEASGKLKNILDNSWNVMKSLIVPQEKGLNVLNHGDCWMNNSMFRYENIGEESKPVEITLLDFQMIRCCHPCIDIIYFLYITLRKAFRLKHMNTLIGIYYDSLERNLKIMNYGLPPFTQEEFISIIHEKYEVFGFYIEALFMPLTLLGDDFNTPKAAEFTTDKFDEFMTSGNSSSIRSLYLYDSSYRSLLDEIVRDLVNKIFPNGINSPPSSLFLL